MLYLVESVVFLTWLDSPNVVMRYILLNLSCFLPGWTHLMLSCVISCWICCVLTWLDSSNVMTFYDLSYFMVCCHVHTTEIKLQCTWKNSFLSVMQKHTYHISTHYISCFFKVIFGVHFRHSFKYSFMCFMVISILL